MEKIVRGILMFGCKILSIFNKVVHKNPNKILLYTNLGFRDNIKAVYDYIIESKLNEKYKVVVSADDYKEWKDKKVKNVKFKGNLTAPFTYMNAKYVFYAFGKLPIHPTKKQIVVNLWHGMPLKTIGNLEREGEVKENYFTYVLATSDFFVPIMKEALHCDNVLVAGQPRNDAFSKNIDVKMFNGFKKVVVWMPTFRKSSKMGYDNSSNDKLLPYCDKEELNILNEYLVKNNMLLYIKLHPLQDFTEDECIDYSNIILHSQKDFANCKYNLYSLLSKTDGLITDYSSVYFDYMLLNKPIAFIVDDMVSYKEKRGFVFNNPLDYMPGDIIINFDGLLRFVDEIASNKDVFAEKRSMVNDLCNKEKNGNYTKSIFDKIGIK